MNIDAVRYDEASDMVAVGDDLMVPLPVYNYARYIKEVSPARMRYRSAR